MMKKELILSFAIALILAGCATSQHEAPVGKTSLDGSWKSTTSSATLRFEQGKLSGNDGCNQFMGSYTTNGKQLSISDKMMSTMMACPAMEKSAAFKTALTSAKLYENEGKKLQLIGADGKTLLEFQALSSVPEDGTYVIKNLNNGKQAVHTLKTPISMSLDKGKMLGNTGCNQYSTTYSLQESHITIGLPATTRKMCPPELMEQEQHFIAALQKSSQISRNGEKWEVRDATSALQFSMIQE